MNMKNKSKNPKKQYRRGKGEKLRLIVE